MQSARQYLFDLGLAKMSRGRFSAEAKAALAKAMSEGMTFSDYVQSTPAAVPTRVLAAPVVRSAKITKPSTKAAPIASQEPQRTEHFMSVTEKNGTLVVLGNCKCGKSIRMCRCSNGPVPPAYLDVASMTLI
jgi:hypothetical protein